MKEIIRNFRRKVNNQLEQILLTIVKNDIQIFTYERTSIMLNAITQRSRKWKKNMKILEHVLTLVTTNERATFERRRIYSL